MEQPKDYYDPVDDVKEVQLQTWDEFVEEQLQTMSFFQRVRLWIESHIFLVLVTATMCGYLAGVYFGESWVISLLSTLIPSGQG